MEQIMPLYLKKPMSPRSVTQARISHSFPRSPLRRSFAMPRAKAQSKAAMAARSSTYLGSPQV